MSALSKPLLKTAEAIKIVSNRLNSNDVELLEAPENTITNYWLIALRMRK